MTQLLTFSAHNIELPDGEQTKPGTELVADSPVLLAALRTLDVVFDPDDGRAHHTIVDLGCLEGGYTVEFARAGLARSGSRSEP
jgi:hypothetical protein